MPMPLTPPPSRARSATSCVDPPSLHPSDARSAAAACSNCCWSPAEREYPYGAPGSTAICPAPEPAMMSPLDTPERNESQLRIPVPHRADLAARPSILGVIMAEILHRALGLTDDEYEAVAKILGRPPNHLELALYAVMWSEHCSYKSSRLHLRRLPTEGPRVLVGPGENAGVIDAGDGIAVAIRIESHNHPSAIEPYQGAATGRGRHPARHLHHGGAAARRHGPALLRAARRRPPALAGRGRRERDLGLRQLGRGADRRRRADLRPLLRPEPARQRALHGRPPRRSAGARHRLGPGQPGRAARARAPAATASAG